MTQFVDYMRSTAERQAGYNKALGLPDVVLAEPELVPTPPMAPEPEPEPGPEAVEVPAVDEPVKPAARSRRPPKE